MEPILGFRSWNVSKGPQRAAERALLLQHAMEPGPPYRSLKPDPELEAWFAARRRQGLGTVEKPARVVPERGTLLPLVKGARSTWAAPGRVQFACKAAGHAEPTAECSCGLYAWFTLTSLTRGPYKTAAAFGAVVAWGHIVLHGLEGFRAQYARIVALSGPGQGVLSHLAAERVGVPWVPLDRLEEIGREFGSPVSVEYTFG